jgi:hypothetical protein
MKKNKKKEERRRRKNKNTEEKKKRRRISSFIFPFFCIVSMYLHTRDGREGKRSRPKRRN